MSKVNGFTLRVKFLLALGACLATASPAAAQGPGVRGGISVDPDQFYVGGHYETSELVDRLHFKPNIELGIGDNVTTIALNMEFVYKFPRKSDWGIYAGAGPGVNFYSVDTNGRGDGTNTEGGFNLLVGAENRSGLFFEMKVGAVDSPDLKFGVGWTFK
jgi:hypothetical protein